MASYKSILSTVVLIFLYSRTTTTFERGLDQMRTCVKHMILSCRLYENQNTDYTVLMSHMPCIQAAIKFWVAGIPFPAVIESYYTELREFIDTRYLESPEDYCNRVFEKNIGKKNTCLSVMVDFKNRNGEIDDSEHALLIALYKKRLHNYLDDVTPANLNNYGLNFNERFDVSGNMRFLRQMCGLEEVGVNNAWSDVRFNDPNEYAVGYLKHIAESAVLSISGARINPFTYCSTTCLSLDDQKNYNPQLQLSNLFG